MKKFQMSFFEDVGVEGETERTPDVEIVPYDPGESVHVVMKCKEEDDPESNHYLQGFVGKSGIVHKVLPYTKLQYEVLFGTTTAFLYHQELEYGKAASQRRR